MIALDRKVSLRLKKLDGGAFQGRSNIGALQHLDIDKAAQQLIMDTDEHARASRWAVPTAKPRPCD